MPRRIDELTTVELENLIQNHRRLRATHEPKYLEALRELGKRHGKGLEFEKSYELIRAAARDHRFISYKELADCSGVDWNVAHYAIGPHLWDLVEYAHLRGWPMLSAIVVNKQNVATGRMETETLRGFIAAAQALGKVVTNEERFLREQQEAVFEWARGALG
jgi:hypothetical protein